MKWSCPCWQSLIQLHKFCFTNFTSGERKNCVCACSRYLPLVRLSIHFIYLFILILLCCSTCSCNKHCKERLAQWRFLLSFLLLSLVFHPPNPHPILLYIVIVCTSIMISQFAVRIALVYMF